MIDQFLAEAMMLRDSIEDEETLNSSISALLDQHTQRLFELYENPVRETEAHRVYLDSYKLFRQSRV